MSSRQSDSPVEPVDSGRTYRPVIGWRLRVLFNLILVVVGLLGANSIYLATITATEWASRQWGDALVYQNRFYLFMFLFHILAGLLVLIPYVVFGTLHWRRARNRRNRRAVRLGYALFAIGLTLLVSGLLLVRIEGLFELKDRTIRSVIYWLHVVTPILAVWLYWLHRLAGRRIRWRVGIAYGCGVALVVAVMVWIQLQDPRDWYAEAPREGEQYFEPSLARTQNGKLIPSAALMMDEYCKKCHGDVHSDWLNSQHHLSSFNNPAYLATIIETRKVLTERDGNVRAARWCAGCHDPVPFFSGAFDDPDYDLIDDATAHSGITCSACHAITHANSTRGNGDYVIEEPIHYPFAYSKNSILQFINQTLVKAKPSFHKQQFLKPFHKTAEFCSVCHKVSLPLAVTHYKEFLRGQNHYDSFLLSGVSGTGARSFYYPETAEENCNGCHMPLKASDDFGARSYPGHDELSVHDHLFLGANTGITWLHGLDEATQAHQKFLKECMRVDIFGVRNGGTIESALRAPLRPDVPTLQPGRQYLIETVIRTLKLGHLFTQGTTDSNQIWLHIRVMAGDRIIGESGALDHERRVDPWAHFVNVFMLDRDGHRIARRNGQDIFVPLYNHQIPPGAGQTVHYLLDVPDDVTGSIRVELSLMYRKFDSEYMEFVGKTQAEHGVSLRNQLPNRPYRNDLPITVLASDRIEIPLASARSEIPNAESSIPAWQRWNDYGIGMLLKGKAELRQAADAFERVEALGRYDGPLNLARVFYREGRLDEAVAALRRAAMAEDPNAPAWTLAWLSGLVNREQGHLEEAEKNFRKVLEDDTAERRRRGFNFQNDYQVINELGITLFYRSQRLFAEQQQDQRGRLLKQAVEQFKRTLALDSENVTAHYNLSLIYSQLGESERARHHQELHRRYRVDDNARDRAIALARKRYPAANHAAEKLVIYSLSRGVPGKDARPESEPSDSHGGNE